MITEGLCHCGCGQKTAISPYTAKRFGYIRGEPRRYVRWHQPRGPKAFNWKDGKTISSYGRPLIKSPNHPRAETSGYVMEHLLIAESVLGRPILKPAVVHHIDGDKANNSRKNLIICENESYHQILHVRSEAYKNSGYAHWRKCRVCKEYDEPANFVMRYRKERPWPFQIYHQACETRRARDLRHARKTSG